MAIANALQLEGCSTARHYISCHVIKVCNKSEQNRTICQWTINDIAKSSRCYVTLWSWPLTPWPLTPWPWPWTFVAHRVSRTISGWVIDNLATFCPVTSRCDLDVGKLLNMSQPILSFPSREGCACLTLHSNVQTRWWAWQFNSLLLPIWISSQ